MKNFVKEEISKILFKKMEEKNTKEFGKVALN